jgi:translocation and assembly module TamB
MEWRRKRVWIGLAFIGLPLIALGIAWAQRSPIAKSMIDDELKARGVQATYEITRIGTSKQRIANIVIGDPARPDLTADWAEIDTSLGLSGATVRAVRAGGVRLRGRLVEGDGVTFGAVDGLLPKPTGEPFRWPDLDVALTDARLSLATPYGGIGAVVNGKGPLQSGFVGQVVAASQQLGTKSCSGRSVRADLSLKTQDARTILTGPLTTPEAQCGGVRLTGVGMPIDVSLTPELTGWKGGLSANIAALTMPGVKASNLSLQSDFEGMVKRTEGSFALNSGSLAAAQGKAGPFSANGKYAIGNGGKGLFVESSGRVDANRIAPAKGLSVPVRAAAIDGTPLKGIAVALAKAIDGLQQGSEASAAFGLDHREGRGELNLTAISAKSRSGASLGSDANVSVTWPGGRYAVKGSASLSGGGFPTTQIRMNGQSGVATLAPLTSGKDRVALTPVRFALGRNGLSLDTIATVDGNLGGGRVAGLAVPLSLRPGQSALSGCFSPRFNRLDLAGMSLSPSQINLCLRGNSVTVAGDQLAGRLGSSPLNIDFKAARYDMASKVFGADRVNVRLNTGERPTLLSLSNVSGTVRGKGASGRYSGASGQIGPVPMLMTEGSGDWAYAADVFTTKAAMTVSDAQTDYRFNPLITDDFALRFANGVITANGSMKHPKTGTVVNTVDIEHRFSGGTGRAVLDVAGLTFGEALQPEELTPITLGVIANVFGTVKGRGQIDWTPNGVTSSGTFRTQGMDMAAAFGPVTGLAGEIRLSDLLGIATEPNQVVTLAGVNPGVAVLNGQIDYQLLPGLKAQVNGGRWPFAGGFLILEPTVLDLNQAAERRLTFRVEGLDMARFIAAMEFENVAATGTFDGTLPMIFDKDGGRIEGGRLVARDGGSLSYVGEISNENLGSMGRFAFDALKSIKYSRLSIDLEGAIDGDVITRIKFAGVNQAPIQGVRASFPIPIKVTGLNNIPFIFNVTITAKFRQLFEMARSFNDPSVLINRMIPQLEPLPKEEKKPVQPLESGAKP